MGKARKNCAAPVAAGVMALVVSGVAQADLYAVAEAGVGHSDNIARTSTNETDETIATAGLELDWNERTRRFRGNAVADLSYFDYLDDTFDSEFVGTANGSLSLGIVPDTFHWVVEDTFGQAQDDPFGPSTPGTREDLNYFSTGPDLMMRFGSTGFTRLFGRWSSTAYETSPLDAERTTAGIAVGRRASERTELALNAVDESIDFDADSNPDYDRKSAFLSYRLDAARTQLNTEIGYTWLDRDGAADESGNALVNISMIREMSAASTLELTLGSQLGDAGDSLRSQLSGNVVGGGNQITATSDPFENRLASIEYRFFRNRTGFSVGASYNDEQYESQSMFDRKRYVYRASFRRQLGRTLDLEVGATLENEKFDNVAVESDELRFNAIMNWRAFRTVGFRLLAERYDRDTSSGTGEFKENRAFLTIAYYWGNNNPSARR